MREARKECEARDEGRRKIKLYFSLSVQIKFLLKSMKHETSIAEELYVCVLFLLDIRFQIHIGYSKFHSGERIQKVADSSAGFTGYVWKEAVSGKRKLRIQKYPHTCGGDLSQLNTCVFECVILGG